MATLTPAQINEIAAAINSPVASLSVRPLALSLIANNPPSYWDSVPPEAVAVGALFAMNTFAQAGRAVSPTGKVNTGGLLVKRRQARMTRLILTTKGFKVKSTLVDYLKNHPAVANLVNAKFGQWFPAAPGGMGSDFAFVALVASVVTLGASGALASLGGSATQTPAIAEAAPSIQPSILAGSPVGDLTSAAINSNDIIATAFNAGTGETIAAGSTSLTSDIAAAAINASSPALTVAADVAQAVKNVPTPTSAPATRQPAIADTNLANTLGDVAKGAQAAVGIATGVSALNAPEKTTAAPVVAKTQPSAGLSPGLVVLLGVLYAAFS